MPSHWVENLIKYYVQYSPCEPEWIEETLSRLSLKRRQKTEGPIRGGNIRF